MRSTTEIESEVGEMLSEADHIHNKALFDAVNEAMKRMRPYGKLGEPLPWSTQQRKSSYLIMNGQLEQILA